MLPQRRLRRLWRTRTPETGSSLRRRRANHPSKTTQANRRPVFRMRRLTATAESFWSSCLRHPWLVLTVLVLIFFANLLVHPGQVLYSGYSDFLSLQLPTTRYEVRSFHETGELPLWCPYSFCGHPMLLHDVYPFHWPL